MSLNGLRIGGQCPSQPLTTMDKLKLVLGCFSIFAPLVLGIAWLILHSLS